MKTTAVRIVGAIVLFVIGTVCWTEAGLTRRVAAAYERFDTLHYDSDDGIDEDATTLSRLLWRISSLREGVQQHRAHVAYWRSQQLHEDLAADAVLAPVAAVGGASEAPRTAIEATALFATANSAFRSAQRFSGERAVAVERLDKVIQSYAEVLRADGTNADASFNYEYVARYRDGVARGRGPVRPVVPADEESGFADLPSGPTIHGRPGAPPPDLPVEEFRTLVPMPQEESQEKPGEGTTIRKG